MSPELLFSICNLIALSGWLLLVLAPRWRWSAGLIAPFVLPAVLAAIYVALLVSLIGQWQGGFGSLAAVARLFENPYALLAGWVHYLAMDLFVGGWEVRDSKRLGISHWVVLPCLAFTLLFGPAGLLLYLAVRTTYPSHVSSAPHQQSG
jgi:hypothetical protein